MKNCILALLVVFLLIASGELVYAQDDKPKEKTVAVSLDNGKYTLTAPGTWEKVNPRFNIVEAEFALPKQGSDEKNGRLFFMRSRGGVEANLERWYAQFTQPDGSSTGDKAKLEELEISGLTTHIVDITGTFADRPGGPVSPPKMRENYRMIGAIIELGGNEDYFLKAYGGSETMKANADKILEMIKSLKVK